MKEYIDHNLSEMKMCDHTEKESLAAVVEHEKKTNSQQILRQSFETWIDCGATLGG